MKNMNNRAKLVGTLVNDPELIFTNRGFEFFKAKIQAMRPSGIADKVELIIPVELAAGIHAGDRVKLEGEFRNYNTGKTYPKTAYSVIVDTLEMAETNAHDRNIIFLSGNLLKEPVPRVTPLNKRITDLSLSVLSVSTRCKIPVIAWFDIADRVSDMKTSEHLCLIGRIQSREYTKVINETPVPCTASEVSIRYIPETIEWIKIMTAMF